MSLEEESVHIHEQHRGKIATALKAPLTTKHDLSLLYTPGVGHISKLVAADESLAARYTNRANTVAIITDGSAVLGLGNIGPAAALPVMEGKAALFKRFADIDAVPILLGTQNPDEIIAAVTAIAPTFAGINLEDIAAPGCFVIEKALRHKLSIPVFHDDQHGTAIVVLAGLLNALKFRTLPIETARIVISGAGAAGLAIFELLWEAGARQIAVVDSKGVLSVDRSDLNAYKKEVAEKTQATAGSMTDALHGADVFIGVSGPGILTRAHVETMVPQPIIFAMANPTPEIYPDEARAGGAYIVATGRSDFPNQINNALAFPGLFKGALASGVAQITTEHMIKAAHAIAALVANPTPEMIVPDIFDERLVPAIVAIF